MSKIDNQKYNIEMIDFNTAYPETPACIDRAVILADEDIHRYENKKAKRISAIACAAAAIIMLAGASALVFSDIERNNSDLIVPPVLSEKEIQVDMEMQVYSSKDDPYYHINMDCVLAAESSVGLPLITAIEFEKTACSECGIRSYDQATEDISTDSTEKFAGVK